MNLGQIIDPARVWAPEAKPRPACAATPAPRVVTHEADRDDRAQLARRAAGRRRRTRALRSSIGLEILRALARMGAAEFDALARALPRYTRRHVLSSLGGQVRQELVEASGPRRRYRYTLTEAGRGALKVVRA